MHLEEVFISLENFDEFAWSCSDPVGTVSLSYEIAEIEQKYNQQQRQIKHAPLMLIKLYALTARCREM